MRFEVRWSNGYWKVFDTKQYTDIGLFGELKRAQECCAATNAVALLRQVKADAEAVPNAGYGPGSLEYGE